MRLFDANCFLGRRSVHTALGQPVTAEELLAEMDRLGVAEALVTHAMAVDGHPRDGNERLLREIAPFPRLHPCWVLLPSSGEMPPPAELVARMRDAGVRAARLCPARHRYAGRLYCVCPTHGRIESQEWILENARIETSAITAASVDDHSSSTSGEA